VAGDFIQEGGQLNLAAGTGNQTVMKVRGDLYQFPSAVITESSNGNPFLELNGNRKQEVAMAGLIRNQVGFRLNNTQGAELRMPLTLPWKLDLAEGVMVSSDSALLTLDSGCTILADSSRLSGTYVNGPLRKLGLNTGDHFLFPVGKEGYLRWLSLHNASGNFTVEYFRSDPSIFGTNLGPGLNHISKLEYWTVQSDGPPGGNAIIELSFASVPCGGVTDPQYLNIAKFVGALWENAGHSGITGNAVQGSVSSGPDDFAANAYTLASTVNLENPLPLTSIDLKINKISGKITFSWKVDGPEIPDHFDLVELNGTVSNRISEVSALPFQMNYTWICNSDLFIGSHYFQIDMVDEHGLRYKSNIAVLNMKNESISLKWIGKSAGNVGNLLMVQVYSSDVWSYDLVSINGNRVAQGKIKLTGGNNFIRVTPENLSAGYYVFHAVASNGEIYSLLFAKQPD
jgi:hypothetical protein